MFAQRPEDCFLRELLDRTKQSPSFDRVEEEVTRKRTNEDDEPGNLAEWTSGGRSRSSCPDLLDRKSLAFRGRRR
jgi:hypothetical protein